MTTWQIILAVIIVGLSIVMPIYYSSEKKKKEQQKELEKIKKDSLIKNLNLMEFDFIYLRYLLGGDRPSQTNKF